MSLLTLISDAHALHAHAGHPERPERIGAVLAGLASAGVGDPRSASPAPAAALERVHPPAYLVALEAACRSPRFLDPDTYVTGSSYAAAVASAGAAIDAVDAVLGGQPAFAVTRPPGHHALVDGPMGFCLLANGAVAVRHAQAEHGVAKVAVIDWDVHHGNGTQAIFWHDPTVLTVSLHEALRWPFSGDATEYGEGAARGTVLNVPIATGTGGLAYRERFLEIAIPAVEDFGPDLVLVACGFDAHRRDPLAGLELEDDDYSLLLSDVRSLCARLGIAEPALLLEGGYDLEALRGSAAAIARAYG